MKLNEVTKYTTAAEWREHLRIFRHYGFDPYNSTDDITLWWIVPERLHEERYS